MVAIRLSTHSAVLGLTLDLITPFPMHSDTQSLTHLSRQNIFSLCAHEVLLGIVHPESATIFPKRQFVHLPSVTLKQWPENTFEHAGHAKIPLDRQ
jgi:hypothetical protein